MINRRVYRMSKPMNLTYHRKGDYLYPNLAIVNETSEPLGKYGLMRRTYLRENRTGWYKSMSLSGKLDHHLAEVERTAQERIDLMLKQMLKANPVPDKETDQMAWAAHMNHLLAVAEELVLKELIYAH